MIEQVQSLLSTLAVSFDYPILDFIQQHLTGPIWDKVWPIVTMFGDKGLFWIAIAVILMIFPKTRKTGLGMAIALIVGVLFCNVWLKNVIARCRPFLDEQTVKAFTAQGLFSGAHNGLDFNSWIATVRSTELPNTIVAAMADAQKDFCFPSGHTIASFEACTAILLRNKWAGIPATILALAIAFSRMYLFVHYPTDVIFAIFSGIIIGLIATLIASIIFKFIPEKKGKYQR